MLEYYNFANIFSPDLIIELPKNTKINEHIITLIEYNSSISNLYHKSSRVRDFKNLHQNLLTNQVYLTIKVFSKCFNFF